MIFILLYTFIILTIDDQYRSHFMRKKLKIITRIHYNLKLFFMLKSEIYFLNRCAQDLRKHSHIKLSIPSN